MFQTLAHLTIALALLAPVFVPAAGAQSVAATNGAPDIRCPDQASRSVEATLAMICAYRVMAISFNE